MILRACLEGIPRKRYTSQVLLWFHTTISCFTTQMSLVVHLIGSPRLLAIDIDLIYYAFVSIIITEQSDGDHALFSVEG